ncbi:protein YchT [Escherichia coli]
MLSKGVLSARLFNLIYR